MITVKNEYNIFIDVDDTLIMWDLPLGVEGMSIKCPHSEESFYNVLPHEPHIQLLKLQKARGAHVVVWSQGGYEWAEAVVKALNLETFVDQCMTKPRAYVDDLPSERWMGERIYIKPESPWGKVKE